MSNLIINQYNHYKIVYYGPQFGGKATNLISLHKNYEMSNDDIIISSIGKTYYVGNIPIIHNGKSHFFHCYTMSGGILYPFSLIRLLEGVHGIVFVVNSKQSELKSNIDSFQDMKRNLYALRIKLSTIPVVIQYNKRDVKDSMDLETLNKIFSVRWKKCESVAYRDEGVKETFLAIASAILNQAQIDSLEPPLGG